MRPQVQARPDSREPRTDTTHVVEAIWKAFKGKIPRERVSEVTNEVAQLYRNARVTAFVPVFIQRTTFERLKLELKH